MIVYREHPWNAASRQVLDGLIRALPYAANPAARRDLLIDFGQFEAAITDTFCAKQDDLTPLIQLLRRAGLETGRALVNPEYSLGCLDQLLQILKKTALPANIALKDSEGFSQYGLYPETYVEAARLWLAAEPASSAVCIGIRGIGASLSSAVAAALESCGCEVQTYTVRPRGHPFHRELVLSEALRHALQKCRNARFAVVDEGPGLSGSSFASVAQTLCALGVPRRNIHFFPHWIPRPDNLCSEDARKIWSRHQAHSISFEEVFEYSGRLEKTLGLAKLHNVSAGAWRKLLFSCEHDYPAVQPQHESRKYVTATGKELVKFTGLGTSATIGRERTRRLAQSGWSPPVLAISEGFTITSFVAGEPCAPGRFNPELFTVLARYLDFRAREFPALEPVPWEALREMISINTGELLSPDALDRVERFLDKIRDEIMDGQTVQIDARMLPHEWIQTKNGYLKADASGHCADHFFPGYQDIAWDAAAATIEFEMDAHAQEHFWQLFEKQIGRISALRRAFYSVAYLAFRAGYCRMAADGLGSSADGQRFQRTAQQRASQLLLSIDRNITW